VSAPAAPNFAHDIDAALRALNDDYAAKRGGGGLHPPLVRFVQPGTFESWLRSKGRWGGQNKMPRCRSDRVIADELAALLSAPPPMNSVDAAG
jgi:hypothetical protein